MKKITILIVMGLVCHFFRAQSQINTSKSGLQIGDKVPDILLAHILNYPSSHIKFSDLKGKLVILDFWATWCSNCIETFPRTDSLQNEFGSQIFFLGVAYEPTVKIRSFFTVAKGPNNKRYNFPSVTADVALQKLFPHYSLPHYIWIGQNGLVKAITGADEVTRKNIKAALLPKKLNVAQKDDIDTDRPLFINEHVVVDSLTHYALLYHNHFEGARSAVTYRKVRDKIRGVAICNQPLVTVYETAIQHLFSDLGQRYFSNRRIIESKDSIELKRSLWNRNAILPNNRDLYNYDLILPLIKADHLYEEMISDLNQNSGYFGRIEKRNVNCLVLKRTSKIDLLKSQTNKSIREFLNNTYRLENAPFSVFNIWLNDNTIINCPVVDDTGYTGKVDIKLENISSIETLNSALSKYNLALVPEHRQMDMFVLSDNSYHPLTLHP